MCPYSTCWVLLQVWKDKAELDWMPTNYKMNKLTQQIILRQQSEEAATMWPESNTKSRIPSSNRLITKMRRLLNLSLLSKIRLFSNQLDSLEETRTKILIMLLERSNELHELLGVVATSIDECPYKYLYFNKYAIIKYENQ